MAFRDLRQRHLAGSCEYSQEPIYHPWPSLRRRTQPLGLRQTCPGNSRCHQPQQYVISLSYRTLQTITIVTISSVGTNSTRVLRVAGVERGGAVTLQALATPASNVGNC